MKEEWKDIKDYEGLYQVSNLGRVKSLNYRRTGKEGILNVGNKNLTKGHFFVELWKNKSGCKKYIHILVAEHFIPNPENKPIVHHIDKDPKNNNVDNLMWVTNMEHRELHQEISKIVSRVRSKTIIQYTLNETFVKKWNSAMDIERELGYNNASIIRCCQGKYFDKSRNKWYCLKQYKGFIWRYA